MLKLENDSLNASDHCLYGQMYQNVSVRCDPTEVDQVGLKHISIYLFTKLHLFN